ncbi:DUF7620 family protein [Rhodococcus marinonascens]|uniref:DUF7620 family protein n=1 Tax=Rhodococcus marinonascens TaxID=38311 RepID=UPI00403A804D
MRRRLVHAVFHRASCASGPPASEVPLRRKRKSDPGLAETRKALDHARGRDEEIAELSRRHGKLVERNGFGEAAETALRRRRKGNTR